jgi:hypothetical protein
MLLGEPLDGACAAPLAWFAAATCATKAQRRP